MDEFHLTSEHAEGAGAVVLTFFLPKVWAWGREWFRKGSKNQQTLAEQQRQIDGLKAAQAELKTVLETRLGEIFTKLDQGFSRVHQRIDEALLKKPAEEQREAGD